MRQEVLNAAGRLGRQPLENVLEVRVGVMAVDPRRVDQAHDRGGTLAGAQGTREQPVGSSESNRTNLVFTPVVVDGQVAVVDEPSERRPALEAVVDRSRGGGS